MNNEDNRFLSIEKMLTEEGPEEKADEDKPAAQLFRFGHNGESESIEQGINNLIVASYREKGIAGRDKQLGCRTGKELMINLSDSVDQERKRREKSG